MSPPFGKLHPRISGGQHRPPFSIESPDAPQIPGETKPRRNSKLAGKPGLLSTPNEKIQTAYDVVNWAAETYGGKRAFGTRNHGEPEGQQFAYTTYLEYQTLVRETGSGLRALGLNKADKVLIYAATSPQWLAVAHGCSSQSIVFVTAYEALGLAGLEHSLESTGAKAIFVDRSLSAKVKSVLTTKAPEVQAVFFNEPPAGALATDSRWRDDLLELKQLRPQLNVLSFTELLEAGRRQPIEPVPPGREDLCAIYYTSGSTGIPKGVLVKQKAVVAAIAGLDSVIGNYLSPKDSFLAYLPLAHVLEFAFENSCLFWGVTMGYSSARTLFDYKAPSGILREGDLRAFQPTFLIGVPAIWERIKKAIISKINAAGLVARTAFWTWLSAKDTWIASGLPGIDSLDVNIFGAAGEVVGSRLRFAMSGGGPVAESTQHFLSMVVAPLINGYGLTETMAMGGLMDPQEWHTGSLGSIPASIEMKLVDYPEAGYLCSNPTPQGEIWIRGDSVTEGYYDNPEDTKSAIKSDGWLCTGDIGQWEPNGHFKIIDRKKNLVKTLNGEYIALEKLESVYRAATLVANICIHASPHRARPIAIVIPSPPALEQLAIQHGLDPKSKTSLFTQRPGIVSDALQQLKQVAKSANLSSIEVVEGVGLTTAVGKLNRRAIMARYQTRVDQIDGTG
ncbi:Long-chain-fatty-acid-CoA ligase 1 [Tolypocladium capitatum]|uniref:Long-chain-fatty-acid-CoA ligase 1 n=1 Tax=Tolypocladium capitatum TaxID=45235 RepID=A0A2K3PZL2_9HYPO|nr:Long-chain-fatty-acid-CoA ligase 1 [Tolypocladium capitatum]